MSPGDVFVYDIKLKNEVLDYRICLYKDVVLYLDSIWGTIDSLDGWVDLGYTKVEIS